MAKQYAYVVWSNTDLTEGRGQEYPLGTCMFESTAKRIGKGRYVQGCDCRITKERIFTYRYKNYGPICIIQPSEEDFVEEEKIQKERADHKKLLTILEKARILGFSDEEIDFLRRK